MNHSDFYIGQFFTSAAGRWFCTDIGTRVIVAIQLVEGRELQGPPFDVPEVVFDEYDFAGCEMEPGDIVPDPIRKLIAWRDGCTDRWGYDLYCSMLHWLGSDGFEKSKVPVEHHQALDDFRALSPEKQDRFVRACLPPFDEDDGS